jgi:hypothetical protein
MRAARPERVTPVLGVVQRGLVLDGVHRRDADDAPTFIETNAPTHGELHALLQSVIVRLMKMLTRRGMLVEDMGQIWLVEPPADGEAARRLRPLQAAAITYRIAFGPRAGRRVLTLRGARPREAARGRSAPAPERRHRRVRPARRACT